MTLADIRKFLISASDEKNYRTMRNIFVEHEGMGFN
jgi:hypothetical protein